MPYATLAEVRAEGLTVAEASDPRVEALIAEASDLIDRACGWWFEPRTLSFTVSGRGARSLELPVPPILITELRIHDEIVPLDEFAVTGSPAAGPRRTVRLVSRRFPEGVDNIEFSGSFGYVFPGSSTPAAIRRACIMLTVLLAPKLASGDSEAVLARARGLVIEERTRDQSIRYADPTQSGAKDRENLTGFADVDAILRHYRRPRDLGAA